MTRPEDAAVPVPVRPPGSRGLHAIDRVTARPVVAVLVDVVWADYAALGFPTALEMNFQAVAAAVTLAMVFVIQHTQSRQQVATQRKLNEILRALPHPDNALIALGEGSDDALAAAHTAHRDLRHDAVTDSHG